MSLKTASKTVVNECMGVKEGESVLIIVDEKSLSIGESLYNACLENNAETGLLKIVERKFHGEEPPLFVSQSMKNSDVVLAPTTKSLSHTRARTEACKNGTRIASMPGLTEEMMGRTLNADYSEIGKLSKKFAEKLDEADEIKLFTEIGTELTLSVEGRKGIADTGILVNKGDFGNLPAGEAYIAPIEGSARGKLVVDGAIAGIDNIDQNVNISIVDGLVQDIKGGQAAKELKRIIDEADDENARNIAELGIGTNKQAKLSSSLLEVEKVYGTVHIAFGDSASMGGEIEAPIHIDGVIKNPTLKIDNEIVIENGKILI